MEERTLFDWVVEYYARHKSSHGNISQDEFNDILKAFKQQVLKDAITRIEKSELDKVKAKVDEEAKAYKRKTFQNLKRSLIIEAILVAFLVGIIVNQVTNLIPELWYCCLGVIIISLVTCMLLVILATTEPKE